MRPWTGTLVLFAGCGFSTSGISIDAAPEPDAPSIDAPRDGSTRTCLERWMAHDVDFFAPTQLTLLGSTSDDRDPYISGDQLRLYFASERTTPTKVYVSTRTSVGDPFPTPALVPGELNSPSSDSKVSITADDRTIVVASNRPTSDQGSVDLWLGTRTTTTSPFANFARAAFPTVNTSDYQLDPEISGDALRIYYADAISPQRIVVASRTATSNVFNSPTTLINSGVGDSDPSLSPDERLLLFSSNRPGLGNGDIWYTTRATATSTTFDPPMGVPVVNTSSPDGDPSLSRDGCTLYFASSRTGNYELFMTTMKP